MRSFIKKYAGAVYIALMAAIMLVILACTNDMNLFFQHLRTMNRCWAAAAAMCIAGYLLLRAAIIRFYVGRRGHRISWRNAMAVTGAGQFYSAITPSASGGQPMQVYYFHRCGIPASIGTACVSAKFIGFQSAYLLTGGLLWLMNGNLISHQLDSMRWLVGVGFAFNSALIVLVVLTAVFNGFLARITKWLVRIGSALKLIRHPEKLQSHLEGAVNDYCAALRAMAAHPGESLAVFGLSLLQVLLFISVPFCMYRAFGLSGTSYAALLAISNLLFISAAFIPLPGAAGAQETGFILFFTGIFPEPVMAAAMICWRFFSYYLLMIIGLIMMAAGSVRKADGRHS